MPPSGFSNPDRWELSETEKSAAGMMGLSEQEFRIFKGQHLLREDEKKKRAVDLGNLVQQVLAKLDADYRLLSVTWNDNTLSWTLEIQRGRESRNLVLPWTLVDDVLDARTSTEMMRLRNMVLFGLGHRDLIFESHR
jgi:hypothetical protein